MTFVCEIKIHYIKFSAQIIIFSKLLVTFLSPYPYCMLKLNWNESIPIMFTLSIETIKIVRKSRRIYSKSGLEQPYFQGNQWYDFRSVNRLFKYIMPYLVSPR